MTLNDPDFISRMLSDKDRVMRSPDFDIKFRRNFISRLKWDSRVQTSVFIMYVDFDPTVEPLNSIPFPEGVNLTGVSSVRTPLL